MALHLCHTLQGAKIASYRGVCLRRRLLLQKAGGERTVADDLLLSQHRPHSAARDSHRRSTTFHVVQSVHHAQMSFHLPPGASVQLVAYDAALGAYVALQRPRPLAAVNAIVLPAPLALRVVSLRPRGTCLNQALAGMEQGAGAGSGSVPGPCEPCCQRAGDIELTQACEGGRGAAAAAPGSQPFTGHAAEQAPWSIRSTPAPPAPDAAAARGTAAQAAAGAAGILPVSVPASAAAERPPERAPTAAELWAGYQAAQVRSLPCTCVLHNLLHSSRIARCVAPDGSHPRSQLQPQRA